MFAPIFGFTDCSIICVSIAPFVSTASSDFRSNAVSIAFIFDVPLTDNEISELPIAAIFIRTLPNLST